MSNTQQVGNIDPRIEQLKEIIDTILIPDCPPDCGGGYGYPGMSGPYNGFQYSNPCNLAKTQRIMSMIYPLIYAPGSNGVILLNTPVLTRVFNQGITDVTILEAAIIMRIPSLVFQLIEIGSSPNISTSGVPLLSQLLAAQPLDANQGTETELQQIINILLQSGVYVNPGMIPVQGYGYDRPLPYQYEGYNEDGYGELAEEEF